MQHIRASGHRVIFAGNNWQKHYIRSTFPNVETVDLDGYNVHYSRTSGGFIPSILSQAPRLLKTIRTEHQWLLSLIVKRRFDGIISDNRYGLYHPSIPSAIMTHQLQPLTGLSSTVDNLLRKFHYRLLNKFQSKWIVDVPRPINLAGKLSHPDVLPSNTSYMGLLSQLEAIGSTKETHLLVLLSGPEPQRTLLSKILWEQVRHYSGKVVFIEGSNEAIPPINIPEHISYHTRITKQALQPLIEDASVVICRSGYSSIMDLITMHKKAILIPTPGQTEQEYLGKHLHQQGVFYSTSQRNFSLGTCLNDVKTFPFKKPALKHHSELYKNVLDIWLATL